MKKLSSCNENVTLICTFCTIIVIVIFFYYNARREEVVVRIRKILYVFCIMMIMSLYSGVLYANETSEGYNIETTTVLKDDKEVEILQSQDGGYLKITQIGQNSQNVKVATSTFDERILLSGRANKGTNLVIDIYQGEECQNSYTTSVGATETFSQTLDILEGYNKVFIYYTNTEDKVESYVVLSINRESAASMEKLTTWIVPSL